MCDTSDRPKVGGVTMQVPAGKYWLIGQFRTANSFRMDIPAQVTVTTFTPGSTGSDHHCAVQDMMTLDYQLAGESLDGSSSAGPRALVIAINHLPRSTPYPVTHAQLQVSFNNGTSWQPAALARICHGQVCTNRYRADYTAPAGAQVSLRVTARDTHGASVTETILGAYQTV